MVHLGPHVLHLVVNCFTCCSKGDCTGVVAVDLDQFDHWLEVEESKELVEVERVLASLGKSIVLSFAWMTGVAYSFVGLPHQSGLMKPL